MKGHGALAGLAVAAVLACAPAAGAADKPPATKLLAGVSHLNDRLALLGQGSSSLGLPGENGLSEARFVNSDGYTFRVIAFGQTVALNVIRRDRKTRPSVTTYLARGRVTPASIEASFADRGRIALRFRPSGRVMRATRRAGCRTAGKAIIARLGLFVGALRFRGEGGYTSAAVHRMHGGSVDVEALVACLLGIEVPGRRTLLLPPRSPLGFATLRNLAAGSGRTAPDVPEVGTHPSGRPEPTAFLADHKLPLARTSFAALAPGGDRARFLAVNASSEGSIGILRLVSVLGPSSAFRFEDTLAGATVRPPAPFKGTGFFRHGSGSAKSWTGSLAVSFLGAPNVPLTGLPFSTQLLRP